MSRLLHLDERFDERCSNLSSLKSVGVILLYKTNDIDSESGMVQAFNMYPNNIFGAFQLINLAYNSYMINTLVYTYYE